MILNQEKDYSYVGSFFAFSIWGWTAAISEWISQKLKNRDLSKRLIVVIVLLQIIFIPLVMAKLIIIRMMSLGILSPGIIAIIYYSLVQMESSLLMVITIHSHFGICKG